MYFRIVCSAVICFLCAVSAFAETPEDFFAAAAKQMAKTNSIQSKFTQTKKLKAFRKPLVIQGELCMDRSGIFVWRAASPIRYCCVIADGKLSQWDEGTDQVMTLDMDSNPALQYLARSLSSFFSGNFEEMQKDFQPVAFSAENKWGEMQPKEGTPASQFIREIRFTFTDDSLTVLKEVRITEKTGDETVIEFHDTVLNQPVRREQWVPVQK